MAELIERGKVLALINDFKRGDVTPHVVDYAAGWNEALDQIEVCVAEDIPVADVRPERHGRWIYHHDIHGISYSCSNCTCGLSDTGTEHYCHYCGAKMDGKDIE